MSGQVVSPKSYPDVNPLVSLFRAVALAANEASTVEEAAQVAVREVCLYAGWDVGHLYLWDPESGELRPAPVWHMSDASKFEPFRSITMATRFPPGIGLPGRVAQAGKPVWSRDVTKDMNFPRARHGIDIGVRGGFALPILAKSEVVGVLEFYSVEAKDPDEPFLEVMGDVAKLIGWVVERTRAAAALAEQAERTHLVIEAAHDAFVSIDTDGVITAWNAQAEAVFGWSHSEVVGASLADTIIPAAIRDAHRAGLARFLATGEGRILNKRIEVSAIHKDGHEFPVELAVWPVRSGKDVAFHAFIHDITERKRTERELQLSEERLTHAQEVASIGSWEWDVAADVVRWSDQLYRNFGLRPDEFGASYEAFLQRVHPEDRELVDASVGVSLQTGRPFQFEHRIVMPDGTVRWSHSRGEVVVDDDGDPVRMFGTGQDVTDRKHTQELLRSAYERERRTVEKLRELDRAKARFLSSTSHELRTPLTSIIGYIDLMRESGKNLDGEEAEMLEIVDRNSRRLLALIEDLLTLSQIEAGSFRISYRSVDLSAVMRTVHQAVLPSITAREHDFVVNLPDDVGHVVGDEMQLERVLLNLVGNAIKFTPDRGKIALEVRHEEDAVVVSVFDTGVGIPSDDLPFVFDRFHRSSVAHEQAIPGTGLGLSISKSIVEQHGGDIEIQSREGVGTTVTVRLPGASTDLVRESA